jgi:hypothetical protein
MDGPCVKTRVKSDEQCSVVSIHSLIPEADDVREAGKRRTTAATK